jgi:hypothetical protein
MDRTFHRRLGLLALLAILTVLGPVPPTQAQPARQATALDQNIVVRIASPRPGESVTGQVVISGYAADRRSQEGSGLNERDIQIWLNDASDPQNLLGYASPSSEVPVQVSALPPDIAPVGYARLWDTCTVPPGRYEVVVWVSSLARPGARNLASVDVEVLPCAPGTTATAAAPAGPVATPARPAAAPPSRGSGPGRVLFQDDFTDPTSGWAREALDPARDRYGYDSGEYYVVMPNRSGSTRLLLAFRLESPDYQAEVDARLLDPPSNTSEVLAFRSVGQSGNRQEYRLSVYPANRTFSVTLYRLQGTQGTNTNLIGRMQAPQINGGDAWNRIGVRLQGAQLTALVNGETVGLVRDDTLQDGRLGIGVSAGQARYLEGRFRNFVVTSVD